MNYQDPPDFQDTIRVHARISRKNLHFVNSTLDTHEGIGLMRTIDRHEGRIMFWIEPDFWSDFVAFADEMHHRVGLEIGTIDTPELIPGDSRTLHPSTLEVEAAESHVTAPE